VSSLGALDCLEFTEDDSKRVLGRCRIENCSVTSLGGKKSESVEKLRGLLQLPQSPNRRLDQKLSAHSPSRPSSPHNSSVMLSRFAPRSLTSSVRRAAFQPIRVAPQVLRTVTTDAASAHAEKDDVPSVCDTRTLDKQLIRQLTICTGGRQAL
jgi:hypothetical protein